MISGSDRMLKSIATHQWTNFSRERRALNAKLAKRHLTDGCVVLYDITNTWFEGEYAKSKKVVYGKGKGGKVGCKQIALGVLTSKDGCPVGLEIFKGNVSDQTTVLDQVKRLSTKYGIKQAVFTGDRGMLTAKRVEEISETDFKVITALTHSEMKTLIEKEDIQKDLFDEKNITEIFCSENGTRYALCKNDKEMRKERESRESLIEKVKSLLEKKASVAKKREPQKVAASVGRIFEKYKIKKFFKWTVGERLKSIRKIENLIDGIVVKKSISEPDEEQSEILKLLGVELA